MKEQPLKLYRISIISQKIRSLLKTGTDDLPLRMKETDTKTAQTAYLTRQLMLKEVSKNDKGGDSSNSERQFSNTLSGNMLDTSGQPMSEHLTIKNGEGGIRSCPLHFFRENAVFERKSNVEMKLRYTIRYDSYTIRYDS